MKRSQSNEHLARKMYRAHQNRNGASLDDGWDGTLAWLDDATDEDRAYWRAMADAAIGEHLSVIHRRNLQYLVDAITNANIELNSDEKSALEQARNAIV